MVTPGHPDRDSSPLRACRRGHRLSRVAARPGDHACDQCGAEISAEYTHRCAICDFDLCGSCYRLASLLPRSGTPSNGRPPASTTEDAAELERLAAEHASLESAGEEQAASDALKLHDAQLLRLRLQTLLERYRERPPAAEELAERYEAEIDGLAVEVRRLKEENALLAIHGSAEQVAGPGPTSGGSATGSSPRSPRASPRGTSPHTQQRREVRRAQAAAAQAHEEVRELWRCQAEVAAQRRRTRVDEWYLGRMRGEMQGVAQALRAKERKVQELKARCAEAEALCREMSVERQCCDEELERERRCIAELHRQALALREACYVPAQLRKKSSALMKFLDQEGGRLSTEKHLRGLQAAAKLYRGVAVHAPQLQPLAGRAKAAMEEEFARYGQLEVQHTRLLQQLHLVVMREVLARGQETHSSVMA